MSTPIDLFFWPTPNGWKISIALEEMGLPYNTTDGGKGRDTLSGAAGTDWLEGGRGRDLLSGGAGADRFVFAEGHGADRIADFIPGADHLVLETGAARFRALEITVWAGGGSLIDTGGGSVVLVDVAPDLLSRGDFVFG